MLLQAEVWGSLAHTFLFGRVEPLIILRKKGYAEAGIKRIVMTDI